MDNKHNDFNNFKVYSNEQLGKVFSFDGEAGIIVSQYGEYPFSKQDIKDGSVLTKGDIVAFRVNHLPFPDETIQVAKFIKKEKEDVLNLKH